MSHYYPSYILLFMVGMLGVFTTKVPEGTNPLFFWSVSGGVALLVIGAIAGMVSGMQRWGQRFLLVPGFVLVVAMLSMAVYIVATLPPYIPGK